MQAHQYARRYSFALFESVQRGELRSLREPSSEKDFELLKILNSFFIFIATQASLLGVTISVTT